MFWKALGELYAARAVVPGFETSQGAEVVLWLLASKGQRPLKDLYRSSQFSEPTARSCLMRLVDQGFATVEGIADDQRQRYARPTPKLLKALAKYRAVLLRVATAAEADSHSTNRQCTNVAASIAGLQPEAIVRVG